MVTFDEGQFEELVAFLKMISNPSEFFSHYKPFVWWMCSWPAALLHSHIVILWCSLYCEPEQWIDQKGDWPVKFRINSLPCKHVIGCQNRTKMLVALDWFWSSYGIFWYVYIWLCGCTTVDWPLQLQGNPPRLCKLARALFMLVNKPDSATSLWCLPPHCQITR